MIISTNSQACNWTSCGRPNEFQCPSGSVEKASTRCLTDSIPASYGLKRLCCDPLKCAYAVNCVSDSCTSSCSPCLASQTYYPEAGSEACTFDFLNVNYNGKKYWCYNP